MKPHTTDAVTQFLASQGMKTEVAYFGDSEFAIGRKIRLNDFEVVYRQDGDELIICDFTALASQDSNGAVGGFIKLIHKMQRRVAQLRQVRGMFVETLSNPDLNRTRQRLAQVFEGQGARWQEINGDRWLVYPMH